MFLCSCCVVQEESPATTFKFYKGRQVYRSKCLSEGSIIRGLTFIHLYRHTTNRWEFIDLLVSLSLKKISFYVPQTMEFHNNHWRYWFITGGVVSLWALMSVRWLAGWITPLFSTCLNISCYERCRRSQTWATRGCR